MTHWRLIVASLQKNWRLNAAIGLGVALTTAVLCGALSVGDSVRATLTRLSGERLGQVSHAIVMPEDRFVREALADELRGDLGDAIVVPLVQVSGSCSVQGRDGSAAVDIIGVPQVFFHLGPAGVSAPDLAALNEAAVAALGVGVGDALVLRMTRPNALAMEAPMSSDENSSVSWRLKMKSVADRRAGWGRFSLRNDQIERLVVYVPLRDLQERLEIEGKVNQILIQTSGDADVGEPLAARFTLADAGFQIEPLVNKTFELRSSQIFIPDAQVASLVADLEKPEEILGYFVNRIKAENGRRVPYSIVAGVEVGRLELTAASLPVAVEGEEPPPPVVINQWLSDELGIGAGDSVAMEYFTMGAGRQLRQHELWGRVARVIPMNHPLADPKLMPAFPGLSDSESCFDWEPGMPVDLDAIRDEDEAYWKAYRGTPKMLVPLPLAREVWGSAYGSTTSIRFDAADLAAAESSVLGSLTPGLCGVRVRAVGAEAQAAVSAGVDFSGLFIGMSFFLIISALALTGMLAGFHVENRSAEIGTLLALGFTVGRTRRLLMIEAAVAVVAGALVGSLLGCGYAWVLLMGLSSSWNDAIGISGLQLSLRWQSIVGAILGGYLLAMGVIAIGVRQRAKRWSIRAQQEGGLRQVGPVSRRVAWAVAIVAGGMAAAALCSRGGGADALALRFFGGGSGLLIAGLAVLFAKLCGSADSEERLSASALGWRGASRRRWRSLTVVGIVASGVFIVVAVGSSRKQPPSATASASSPTGGFGWIVELARPIYRNPNNADARSFLGLDTEALATCTFTGVRVRAGDDASCLNVSRAQEPVIIGVDPYAMSRRKAFSFAQSIADPKLSPWYLLLGLPPDGAIPAMLDVNTALWGLGLKLGDDFVVHDDAGTPIRLRLVALLKPSILQGKVIIGTHRMVEYFPSVDGYGMLLVDGPRESAGIAGALREVLVDQGAIVTPAADRMARLLAVENTYLAVFLMLGGLGLCLGALGVGVMMARSVTERRAELAVLSACGYERARLRWLLMREHGGLLLAGVGLGAVGGIVAALPALLDAGGRAPWLQISVTAICIVVCGWGALVWALRVGFDPVIRRALQNE